jgi:hypothetical protein
MKVHHEDTAHEFDAECRWRTFGPFDGVAALLLHDGTFAEAAIALNLDPTEIEWACDEYGRCDSRFPTEGNGTVCWVPDDEAGWEWPTAEAPTEDNNYNSPR